MVLLFFFLRVYSFYRRWHYLCFMNSMQHWWSTAVLRLSDSTLERRAGHGKAQYLAPLPLAKRALLITGQHRCWTLMPLGERSMVFLGGRIMWGVMGRWRCVFVMLVWKMGHRTRSSTRNIFPATKQWWIERDCDIKTPQSLMTFGDCHLGLHCCPRASSVSATHLCLGKRSVFSSNHISVWSVWRYQPVFKSIGSFVMPLTCGNDK